ncbi:MAG TPA: hypothetical protein EYG92_07690 [Lutibacter sp.]|nr:hypothetical protein [Lutibacter sp.]
MKGYINKWTYKRVIQAGLGVFLVYYYTQDHNKFALVFGIVMLVQAFLNIGCFSTKGCDNSVDEKEIQEFAKEIKEVEK